RTFDMTLPDEYGFNQVTVAWSPDGTMLAAGAEETVIWNMISGAELAHVNEKTFSLAWAPDSQSLAIGSERHVSVVKPLTGQPIKTFDVAFSGNSSYYLLPALDWSDDGKYIAAGGSNGDAIVWNASSGDE